MNDVPKASESVTPDNIKKTVISGFYWVVLGQYLPSVAKFISGIYLARKIEPIFFGEQTLAYSTSSLLWAFVMLGELPAVLRRKDDVEEYLGAVLLVRTLIVAILAIVMLLLWGLQILPGSTGVQQSALIFFFAEIPSQLTSIYSIYQTKLLLFRQLSLISIVASVFGAVVACVLAAMNYPVEALMSLIIGERLMCALLTLMACPRLFMPCFNKVLIWDFLNFAKYMFVSSSLDRLGSKIVDISIGSVISELKLGFYQRATSFGGIIQMLLTGSLNEVIQPYFAKLQENRQQLGSDFEFVSCLLMRTAIYFFGVTAVLFPTIIHFLYGDKWLPAVPLFWLLLPFAILQSFRSTLRWTHQVVGSGRGLTVAQGFEVTFLLGLLALLTGPLGIDGVIASVDFSAIIGVLAMLIFFKRHAHFSIQRIFVPPMIGAAIAAGLLMLIGQLSPIPLSLVAALASFLLFTTIYVGTLFALEYLLMMRISRFALRLVSFRYFS